MRQELILTRTGGRFETTRGPFNPGAGWNAACKSVSAAGWGLERTLVKLILLCAFLRLGIGSFDFIVRIDVE
jgi:hypothetical protein